MKLFNNKWSVVILLNLFVFFSLKAQEATLAEAMEVDSVTVHYFHSPILKTNDVNPVFQINIEVKGSSNPIFAKEIVVELFGDNVKNDAGESEIFYSEERPYLRDKTSFGSAQTAQNELSFSGNQQLKKGDNYFWLSVKLKDKANIFDMLGASFTSIKVGNKTFTGQNNEIPGTQRLGIALRKHNDDGVNTYRIPGLATTNEGTLIAVYDMRHINSSDLQEDIDIGMSRSTDGGRSWEPMKTIMDMGEWGGLPNDQNGIGDPSVLVDRGTNTIWVAAVWAHGQPGKRNWLASNPGLEPETTSQLMLVKSENDGIIWSDPINITKQIKDPKWHLLLQGPGKGITLKDGTIVFPAQFKDDGEMPHSTIFWSKDHGKTWKIGTGAKSNTTESQVVELDNGNLMLNMRDNRNSKDKTETNGRSVYTTTDLGKTWQKHTTSRTNVLQEPTCMASLIKETFIVNGKEKKLVLFSNPNTKRGRNHMTIKASFDDGNSWPENVQLLLDEGSGYGYSCLTKIDDYTVGILYEGSRASMTFQAIPIRAIIKSKQSLNYIFEKGKEGYKCFRIPAIVTTTLGTIVAFAEGRKKGCSDTGDIDLVMKRSDDGGETWSPLQVVWDDGENVCGNPAPVVDRETGDIRLLMTWNLGEDSEREIIKQKSKDSRRVFVSSSSNDGKTWSAPKEITSSVKKKNWTWYATGPCHGIQLENKKYKGRLVVPCDHIEAVSNKYFSHIIYSGDHGKTWKLGGTTPQDKVNECTVAELADGTLMLNMRNYDRSKKARKISFSKNGGKSWSDIQSAPPLVEPICQGSLLADNNGNTLYFINPASESSRSNIQLKISTDKGKTWQLKKLLFAGPAAYSDITKIDERNLGCLFEAGWKSAYQGIVFQKVAIE